MDLECKRILHRIAQLHPFTHCRLQQPMLGNRHPLVISMKICFHIKSSICWHNHLGLSEGCFNFWASCSTPLFLVQCRGWKHAIEKSIRRGILWKSSDAFRFGLPAEVGSDQEGNFVGHMLSLIQMYGRIALIDKSLPVPGHWHTPNPSNNEI